MIAFVISYCNTRIIRYGLCCLLFCFNIAFAHAQTEPFTRVFGDSTRGEKAVCIQQASDGTLFMLGQESWSGVRGDVVLFRMTASGEVIWKKYLTESNYNYPSALKFNASEDRLILVYETHDSTTSDINSFIQMLDTAGTEVWKREFGSTNSNEVFSHILIASDGSFWVSGFTSGVSGTFGNDFLVVHYNDRGQIIFFESYGSVKNDVASSIVEVHSNEFLIFGDTQTDSARYNVYGVRIDSNGNQLGVYEANWPYNSGCKKSCKSANGDIYVVGESATSTSSQFDVYLTKFNNQGVFLWQKLIPATNFGDAGLDLAAFNSGQIMITGYGYDSTTSSTDILALLVDTSGNEVQKKTYFIGATVDFGLNVISSKDGGYIIAGTGINEGSNDYVIIYDTMSELMTGTIEPFNPIKSLVQVFPNPSLSNQKIFVKHACPESIWILRNAVGQKVYEGKADSAGQLQISLLSLQPGTYILQEYSSGRSVRLIRK